MMSGAQLLGVGLPLLGGVALDERLVERPADQRDRLLLEVLRRRSVSISLACSATSARACSGVCDLPKNWLISGEVHREGVDLALVNGEDAVLVAGERGEAVDVLPHPLVGGVEQVGAVLVHLDSGLGLGSAVGVAADVVSAVEDENAESEVVGAPLGDGEPEQAGADDDEISVHTLSWSTAAVALLPTWRQRAGPSKSPHKSNGCGQQPANVCVIDCLSVRSASVRPGA